MDPDRPADESPKLPRVLGPIEALCVIVGSVIGSGIFIVPARVAEKVPAMGGILLLWVVGGVFSLAGALTLAELGAMLPQAGGPYVYLRAAFGKLPAFLFGWVEFLVIRAGSLATLAAAFAIYANQLMPAPSGIDRRYWELGFAVAAMAVVAAVNVAGTKLGGQVQVVGTTVKVGALVAMMVLPFLMGRASVANLTPVWPERIDGSLFKAMMAAMVGVLWAYDGWVNSSELAEEVRDPGRNIPRSLMQGIAVLVGVYVGMTVVYHLVLPMHTVVAAANAEKGSPQVVAAVFCESLLGRFGIVAISLVVMCSTLVSLNGNALSGPRAYFAMARDGLFPQSLCRIHPKYQTPANAVVAQAVWAIGLSVVGTIMIVAEPPASSSALPAWLLSAWKTLNAKPLYDVLYSYVIFGGIVIYTLTITSVFVLRVRRPDLPRPYRTWGYPITPLLYVAASCILLGSMLSTDPSESLAGLLIILLGIPAYLVFARRSPAATTGILD
jgi:APA family basic amino acid/polyamine antiporter